MSKIRNVFFADEAHDFISKSISVRSDLGEHPLISAARLTRRAQIGLIFADQTPSQIPGSVIANVGTRVCLRLINGPCIATVSDSMSLSYDMRRFIPELPQRWAIIQYPARYAKPFVLEIPHLNFDDESISDSEINQIMQPVLASLKWKSREDLNAIAIRRGDERQGKVGETRQPSLIARAAEDYLIDVTQHPFDKTTLRDKRLRLSNYMAQSVRDELVNAGLLKIHKVSYGRRSGVMTILEVTQPGYDYLASKKVNARPPRGKGGWLHKWFQALIHRMALKRFPNCHAVVEDATSGKSVDVSLFLPASLGSSRGQKIAYEVVVKGEIKELSNIAKDIEVGGYDAVILCCEDLKTLEHLRKLAGETFEGHPEIMEKVSFSLLSEFFES